ncbi:MAG: hypothetical protein ACRC17_00750 [Culicoidibacterales bacterium]
MSLVKITTTKKGDTIAKVTLDERDVQLLSFASEQKNMSIEEMLTTILSENIDPIEVEFQNFLLDFYKKNSLIKQTEEKISDEKQASTVESKTKLVIEGRE